MQCLLLLLLLLLLHALMFGPLPYMTIPLSLVYL
jgi:hypothetical protein